jgi:transposase
MLQIEGHARAPFGICPTCGQRAEKVHSRYTRRIADLPVAGRRLVIRVEVRRFFCPNTGCGAKTFVEQVRDLTHKYMRRSPQATEALETIGLALAGRAGARLAERFGLRASRNTVLRVVARIPEAPVRTPEVLGIDDFAMRRGHRYGTILVDMGTHRPIDLLPDRETATVAAWLVEHPGANVICRDRGGEYAEGSRIGAPDAIQVADRWHLLHNLAAHVEKAIGRLHRTLTGVPPGTPPQVTTEQPQTPPVTSLTPAPTVAAPKVRRQGLLELQTRERYEQVQQLRNEGLGIKAIRRRLGLAIGTVRRYAHAERVEDLLGKATLGSRGSQVDPYADHLRQRWNEGLTLVTELHQELRELGYTGSYSAIRDWIRPWRDLQVAPPKAAKPPKVRAIASWVLKHPKNLTPEQNEALAGLRDGCPQLDRLVKHVRGFADMLTKRQGQDLDTWIAAVNADDLPELHSFANGLERDHAAVLNGLTLPHSSGAVEGNVNRLKMIKRQMYGRANHALLRKRVLLS